MTAGLSFRSRLAWLIAISAVIRALVAGLTELGNDEVYYWTYALYPDLSHFDHPPMVGWIIQLFTLDLTLQSGFFLRLPGIVLGSLNTWLVFTIGKKLRDELTGWYAALLYTASIYGSIICGVFILPDTPQMTFWLLAVLFFSLSLTGKPSRESGMQLLLAGIATGLAMLSKYTSVMLWAGVVAYMVIYRRDHLRSPWFYAALLVSIALFTPVIAWNARHDFISFSFQGGRVGLFSQALRPDKFLTELGGEILYNNPVNFGLILWSLIIIARKKLRLFKQGVMTLLLLWSLPTILLFLGISLFRSTLPHWTGPAYTTLIFLPAAWLASTGTDKVRHAILPAWPAAALSLWLLVVIAGVLQVTTGIFYSGKETEVSERGEHDISMDMYGWKQIGTAFAELSRKDIASGAMPAGAPIFSYRWFPAANIDFYVARPAGTWVLAIGPLKKIHKYYWINQAREGFRLGMDGWYITTSRDFADPAETIGRYFGTIIPRDTIPITRRGETAGYAFIYQARTMIRIP